MRGHEERYTVLLALLKNEFQLVNIRKFHDDLSPRLGGIDLVATVGQFIDVFFRFALKLLARFDRNLRPMIGWRGQENRERLHPLVAKNFHTKGLPHQMKAET